MAGIDSVGEEPGLQSVASATAQPASTSRPNRRIGCAEEKRCAGQQDRNGFRAGESGHTFGGDAHEVIGGECIEFHSELGPSEWGQFVGVEVNPPPQIGRIGEQSPGLFEIEDALFAEDVDRLGQAAPCDFGVDFIDQPTDPRFRILTMFGRHLVGCETRGVEIDRMELVGAPDDLEHANLGFKIEAVARLRFDGRRAVGQKAVKPLDGPGEKVIRRRRPRFANGRVDPAARSSDFHIGFSAKTPVELAFS